MFRLSSDYNENYIGQIVKLDTPEKHSNADSLQIFYVNNHQVITNMEYQKGDLVAFFPIGSCLNKDFVRSFNFFQDPLLNADGVSKGYMDKNARIKALSVRGVKCEGWVIPIKVLLDFLGTSEPVIPGILFDSYGDILLVEKYIIKTREKGTNLGNTNKKVSNSLRGRMIENQFQFHIRTPALKNNTTKILGLSDTDVNISITNKIHGTSAIISNVLAESKLSWFQRLLRRCGVNIPTTEYLPVYSSRQVIKGSIDDENTKEGFYKSNVWKEVFDDIMSKRGIPKGYSIFFEIAGFTSTGKAIQGQWDYRCEPKEKKIFVYRITNTNPDGKCIELSWNQIKQFCNDYNLQHVPELYNGKLYDFLKKHKIKSDKVLVNRLSDLYNIEGDCTMCKNKVPTEGIVLRIDDLNEFNVFKLKGHRFLIKESSLEEATMEDEN